MKTIGRAGIVVTGCLSLSLLAVGCGGDDEGDVNSELVPAMLAAIRRPEAGEFPTEKSVIEFFFEQVRTGDIDEATKAFPIVERFEKVTMADRVRHVWAFDPYHTPVPGARFHNLMLAMQGLQSFHHARLTLLGIDPQEMSTVQEDKPDALIEELEARLDASKLKNVTVESVRINEKFPRAVTDENRPYKAMGVTEECLVEIVVECGNRKVSFECFLLKIDDNWRIGGVMPNTRSPAATRPSSKGAT